MDAVPEDNIRNTLTTNGWQIDFLGPASYLGSAAAFPAGAADIPEQIAEQFPPEAVQHVRQLAERFAAVSKLLDDDRAHLPFTVVHAHRVD